MNSKVMEAFRSVELNEQELEKVVGGVDQTQLVSECFPSSGWFCSISAECNGVKSCNPFYN